MELPMGFRGLITAQKEHAFEFHEYGVKFSSSKSHIAEIGESSTLTEEHADLREVKY
jgi:hypothetical protein